MAGIRTPQNPGIGGLDELTLTEEALVQNLAGLSYSTGDILYYDGTNLTNLGAGSNGDVVTLASGIPSWAAAASGSGDVVGPASAVDSNFAAFDTTTGKLIKDSTFSSASFAAALGADDNYVTDAEKVVIGNTSGTNTGDQTSIVGITGTKAQFDTAVTDGNFLYSGDITQYTDEMAQDAVGGILGAEFTYSDATPSIVLATGGIDETKLDASVNASLDLADSAVQNLADLSITASAAELNLLDGVTATTAELNILDGVTSTAAELNILDGATLTTTELNYVDGVTSAIQTQLNAKAGIDPRIDSSASSSTITPDKATYDEHYRTAQAAAITINNATSPAVGHTFAIYLTDNATARAISFGAHYVGLDGLALPTTTTISKTMEIIIKYVTATKAIVSYVEEA